jgi:hypothetical protein
MRESAQKKRRARLFKKSRPHIRPLESKDMGWLWAAYKVGSFKFPEDLSQEEFTTHISQAMNGVSQFLIEDENKQFSTGRGPVGLIGVASDGTRIEPGVAVFKWATPKNILRGFVAFFQYVKSSPVSECVVRAPAKDKLMKRMVDYGVIYPRSMETVYGVRGKR